MLDSISRASRPISRTEALLKEIENDYVSGEKGSAYSVRPLLSFPTAQSAYLQILPPPPPEEAVAFWLDFVRDVRDRPYLREIKRPRRPQ